MVLTFHQSLDLGSKSFCIQCKIEKPISLFYKRTSTRHDPVCIECRRKERQEKYHSKKNIKKQASPKRIIEPKKKSNEHLNSNKDTATIIQNCDFDDMEKICGKMTLSQRHEAVQRFNEFITLLREGYSEIVESEVYVRKD